ncbi:phosphopantothenoylcysteine decarboxylase [Schistocerca nitens]|uniref:phosphopantothenoylcysteine decarboxylase n=1 Tax=Schistocerca nitens TaxID=7011 RepID=UPI0021178201|nr:phosphopantothenoylcysteine decarboxylase [Schistocerca nitens]
MPNTDFKRTPGDDGSLEQKKRILIGCTGSVATIKLPNLVAFLNQKYDLDIRIIVTNHAQHFYSPKDIPSSISVYTDDDEWSMWSRRGDPVLHIELAKWADIFVIAPLDANTLAKLSHGMCDNLLTCVARAWEIKKPLLFCPAMNTKMWEHPITAKQIESLKEWGYCEVPCISKTLMCGDTGLGAMAEIDTIVAEIMSKLNKPHESMAH